MQVTVDDYNVTPSSKGKWILYKQKLGKYESRNTVALVDLDGSIDKNVQDNLSKPGD